MTCCCSSCSAIAGPRKKARGRKGCGSCREPPAQRAEPGGESLGEEPRPMLPLLGGAVERRPPFDEGGAALGDGVHADRRYIVAHGKARRAAKGVAVAALDVGMGEKNLPDQRVAD